MESLAVIAGEIARVLANLDESQLEKAQRMILETEGAVTTTGQGRSGFIATMTAMRLMHLSIPAQAAAEATARAVVAGDLLLVVSGSGQTPVSLSFAKIAKSVGARVLLFTKNPQSALGEVADLVVEIPAQESGQPGGSLFEQSALLALDAVVREISLTIPDARTMLRARHTNLL